MPGIVMRVAPPFRKNLPWWWVVVDREWDMNADVCAFLPFAPAVWLWRFWRRHRWCLEHIGVRFGWYSVAEGEYYRNGRWAGIGEKFPTYDERIAAIRSRYAA